MDEMVSAAKWLSHWVDELKIAHGNNNENLRLRAVHEIQELMEVIDAELDSVLRTTDSPVED